MVENVDVGMETAGEETTGGAQIDTAGGAQIDTAGLDIEGAFNVLEPEIDDKTTGEADVGVMDSTGNEKVMESTGLDTTGDAQVETADATAEEIVKEVETEKLKKKWKSVMIQQEDESGQGSSSGKKAEQSLSMKDKGKEKLVEKSKEELKKEEKERLDAFLLEKALKRQEVAENEQSALELLGEEGTLAEQQQALEMIEKRRAEEELGINVDEVLEEGETLAEQQLALESFRKEQEKAKKQAQSKSLKVKTKKMKDQEDRKKFVDYLKGTGRFTGKQLGPMKFINLVNLYEEELKKDKREAAYAKRLQDERKKAYEAKGLSKKVVEKVPKEGEDYATGSEPVRHMLEKVLKNKWDKEDVEKKKKDELKRKKRKLIFLAEQGLERLTKKVKGIEQTSESSKAQSVEEDIQEITADQFKKFIDQGEETEAEMVEYVEGIKVKPLQVQVPISDWFSVTINDRTFYKLIRVDGSYKNYVGITRILNDISREDLNDLYQIGKRKYGNYRENFFDHNGMLYESLEMMYEPEMVQERIEKYSPIRSWIHYEKCGVYSLNKGDVIHYFLVEKDYNHHVDVLRGMLGCHLVANSRSEEAIQLVARIFNQMKTHNKAKKD